MKRQLNNPLSQNSEQDTEIERQGAGSIPRSGVFGYDVTGGGGGGGGTGTPAPAPRVNRTLQTPNSGGTQIGLGIRSAAGFLDDIGRRMNNSAIGGVEKAANAISYPGRVAGGVVRDIGAAALTGEPSANEGQPLGSPTHLPRFAVGAQPVTSTPLNSRSGATPVKRQLASAPAPAPAFASPRSPTANPATPLPRRATYNDESGATYTTGDGRVGHLPAGVAVVHLPNGTNAFGATGASVTAAERSSGSVPAPLARTLSPTTPPTSAEVPQTTAPAFYGRSLSGDVSGAERERAAALSQIDNQLLRVKPNSRGRREFIANLLSLKRQLTGQRVDQATDLATQGAQLDNSAAIEAARLGQGANEGNANRVMVERQLRATQQEAADARAFDRSDISQVLVDRNGRSSLLRKDGGLSPLRNPDGSYFQPAQDPALTRTLTVSPDAQYKALNDRLTQLQQFGTPEGQEDSYNKQVADLQAKLANLEAGGQGAKKVVRTGSLHGRKVIQYQDGSIEYTD